MPVLLVPIPESHTTVKPDRRTRIEETHSTRRRTVVEGVTGCAIVTGPLITAGRATSISAVRSLARRFEPSIQGEPEALAVAYHDYDLQLVWCSNISRHLDFVTLTSPPSLTVTLLDNPRISAVTTSSSPCQWADPATGNTLSSFTGTLMTQVTLASPPALPPGPVLFLTLIEQVQVEVGCREEWIQLYN
jgi:hypothetical protein